MLKQTLHLHRKELAPGVSGVLFPLEEARKHRHLTTVREKKGPSRRRGVESPWVKGGNGFDKQLQMAFSNIENLQNNSTPLGFEHFGEPQKSMLVSKMFQDV